MNWFKRKNNIKKRDERSTYLKVENGRVVPVTGDEPDEQPDNDERFPIETKDPTPSTDDSKSAKWMKWLWLLLILALGVGTVQLVSGLASENKEVFKLQEIQRNTLKITDDDKQPVEKTKTDKTVEDKETDKPSISITDKTTEWRKNLLKPFSGEPSDEETPAHPVSEVPEPTGVNLADKNLLFAIRTLDEQGSALLEQVRDASVSLIRGDISRGQYHLKLKSVELKMKRYNEEVYLIQTEVDTHPSYGTLMEYVQVKKDSLKSLDTELRLASLTSVAPVFNSYVDIHNELTLESDKEFVRQLQKLGYEATIQNGVIEYR